MRTWSVALSLVLLASSGCISQALRLDEAGPTLPQVLLWSDQYPTLVVEIQAVEGREPAASAVEELRTTLEELTGKARVVIAGPNPLTPQGGGYTDTSLLTMHRAVADFAPVNGGFVDGGRAYLHILFLDGHLANTKAGTHVLARAYHNEGLIVVFRDGYDEARSLTNGTVRPLAHQMDRYVLLHEVGHAMGLVDEGIPMTKARNDPKSSGHSTNPGSVMYAKPRMSSNEIVYGSLMTSFDADDLRDIASFRRPYRASAAAA